MKRISILKSAWIILSLILLALPVFLPSGPPFIDVINICLVVAFVLSYPLNLLFGWLFFVTVWFDYSIGSLYLMIFVFCVTGYVQWFVLVPRLVKFIRQTFFRNDLEINVSATVTKSLPLLDTTPEISVQDWQKRWYDEQKRTPVERLFDKDED